MDKKKSAFNADVVIGVFGILLSVWWIVMALGFPGSTAKDGTPGPAVFPIGTAAILIVLSVLMILAGLKNKTTYFNFRQMDRDNKIALALSVVCFILFLILWNYVHYIAARFVMSFGLGVLYRMKPVKAALLGAVFGAGTYFFFTKVLMVMLDIAR